MTDKLIATEKADCNTDARAASVRGDLGETNLPRPSPCPPVSLSGKMTPDGLLYENDGWFDWLTKPDDETGRTDSKGRPRRIGRDPMSMPLDVLTAAGHPPSRTRSLVARLTRHLHEEILPFSELRGHRDLRRYCLGCAENAAEVRRCAIINCPFWPYRMRRNPHNPRRGRNPFSSAGRK